MSLRIFLLHLFGFIEKIFKPRHLEFLSLKFVLLKFIKDSFDSSSCSEVSHEVVIEDCFDRFISKLAISCIEQLLRQKLLSLQHIFLNQLFDSAHWLNIWVAVINCSLHLSDMDHFVWCISEWFVHLFKDLSELLHDICSNSQILLYLLIIFATWVDDHVCLIVHFFNEVKSNSKLFNCLFLPIDSSHTFFKWLKASITISKNLSLLFVQIKSKLLNQLIEICSSVDRHKFSFQKDVCVEQDYKLSNWSVLPI